MINLSIPSLNNKFIDLRDSLLGDAYSWSWVRPLTEVRYLAIHHSGASDTQTPKDIASFHVNDNGWGGIGYHFLIGKEGSIYYVGDISTARANVANLNEQVIGICLIGNFTQGKLPTDEQLSSVHSLCDFFINNYPDLVNLNSWEAVVAHKDLPGQSTNCPGDNWSEWKDKVLKGIMGKIVFNSPVSLKTQVESMQTTLASLNQRIIFLQEELLEKDEKINQLNAQVKQSSRSSDLINDFVQKR